IRHVHETRGYLLDPHSAIAYRGLVERMRLTGRDGREGLDGRDGRLDGRDGLEGQDGRGRSVGGFLARAHPAKFGEIVEPIVGHAIEKPSALADALARRRAILRMDVSLSALKGALHD